MGWNYRGICPQLIPQHRIKADISSYPAWETRTASLLMQHTCSSLLSLCRVDTAPS